PPAAGYSGTYQDTRYGHPVGYKPSAYSQAALRGKPISVLALPVRKKKEDEKRSTYRPIRLENLEHLSIIDPLEALGTGKSMTNRRKRTRQPKTTYYEYGGEIHLTPPKGSKNPFDLSIPSPKPARKTQKKRTKPTRRKR
ncbi:MAG: hypothetical protein O0X96_05760, partial [Methanocorpusculum sp.]|nr:hypothetical protein [Methanocorpusculum sp.]